jgi:hypothetical protein
VLVKIRVPDLLEIPISHVLCENADDAGHGQSWTVVNYILQANLITGEGADEDPLPPNGLNPHPMPNPPFGRIWNDADFVEHGDQEDNNNNAAPNLNNAAIKPWSCCTCCCCRQSCFPNQHSTPKSPCSWCCSEFIACH